MAHHASSSTHLHSILVTRPRFPDEWSSIDISQDELSLPNTLPVGQSFVWHRRPLHTSTSGPSPFQPIDPISEAHEQEDHKHLLLPSQLVDLPPVEQDAPLEEWSRAISSPDRVILLRQSSSKIYYTSVLPSSAPSPTELDKSFIESYFSISTSKLPSLPTLYRSWSNIDPLLFGQAQSQGKLPRGVRVLRQDVWECLISFITSSANNVPRITSLMHRLSHHFSSPLLTLIDPSTSINPDVETIASTTTYHLFPCPVWFLTIRDAKGKGTERFVGVQDDLESVLRELGFGYRAGFIMNTFRCLIDEHGGDLTVGVDRGERDDEAVKRVGEAIEGFLISLREKDVITAGEQSKVIKTAKAKGKGKEVMQSKGEERWRTELLKFKGVGRKVADCIGLMSLDRPNVVPIDTHIQQIAARHPSFPGRLRNKATSTESVYREVQEFLARVWGGEEASECQEGKGMAGWVQAVMFAADLKGSTAVKVEELLKIEEPMMEVVQEDPADLGRGKRIKVEESNVVDIKPTVAVLNGSWSVPVTPSRVSSAWSDASPADTALLTPMEGSRDFGAIATPTKGSLGAEVGPLGKRKAGANVVVKQEYTLEVASTILAGNDLADRVKRRRTMRRQ